MNKQEQGNLQASRREFSRSAFEEEEMSSLIQPTPPGPKWPVIVALSPLVIGMVLILFTLPFNSKHEGLLALSVLSFGIVWWSADTIAKKRFQSKQGTYARADRPVAYFFHLGLTTAFAGFTLTTWFHFVLLILTGTGVPGFSIGLESE